MNRASHTHEEHTAEVQIRLRAPSLDELYAEAGRALMELMAGAAIEAPAGPPEQVSVRSIDRDALMVDWLNELIYRVETRRTLYGEIAVRMLSEMELSATLHGAPAPGLRTLVKAASFHGLAVVQTDDGGWTATVVLDV